MFPFDEVIMFVWKDVSDCSKNFLRLDVYFAILKEEAVKEEPAYTHLDFLSE